MTEQEITQRELALKESLNSQFLKTLLEAHKVYGDDGDSVANAQFVCWVFHVADKPVPDDLEPYRPD